VSLAEPCGIEAFGEFGEALAQVLGGGEMGDPQQLLLEGSDGALGDAVALGLADEGRRAGDAEEGDFALEVVCHVV